MTYSTDTITLVGSAHQRAFTPGQDAASAGVVSGKAGGAFAIVSDGCSSGGRAEIGAQLLTAAAERAARLKIAGDDMVQSLLVSVLEATEKAACDVALADDDLFATLLYAIVTPDRAFVRVYGDGVVAVGFRDGTWQFLRVEWEKNTPFYPIYYTRKNVDTFLTVHGSALHTAVYVEHVTYDPDGTAWRQFCTRHTVAEGMMGLMLSLDAGALRDICALGVFTDGVASLPTVPWDNMMREIVAFKSTTGAFLRRRVGHVLRDLSIAPTDDLSGAMVWLSSDDGGGS